MYKIYVKDDYAKHTWLRTLDIKVHSGICYGSLYQNARLVRICLVVLLITIIGVNLIRLRKF